jgi:hypothetical protein
MMQKLKVWWRKKKREWKREEVPEGRWKEDDLLGLLVWERADAAEIFLLTPVAIVERMGHGERERERESWKVYATVKTETDLSIGEIRWTSYGDYSILCGPDDDDLSFFLVLLYYYYSNNWRNISFLV